MNRHYSSAQGRFTQVDPIGMSAASLSDPQSLNLYAYCGNDPINRTDPDGLFSWKKLFGFFSKAFKVGLIVGLIVGAVLLGGAFIAIKLGVEAGGWFGGAFLGFMHGVSAALALASPSVIFSLAASGSAWALAGAGIWAFGAAAAIGAVSSLVAKQSKDAPSRRKLLLPCISAKAILGIKAVREVLAEAWRNSQADPGKNEFSGWVFLDNATQKVFAVGGVKGITLRGGMKISESDYFLKQRMEEFRRAGRDVSVLIDFHTHPSGSNASPTDNASLRDQKGNNRRPLGIIVKGENDYSVYTEKQDQIPSPELLNKCLNK